MPSRKKIIKNKKDRIVARKFSATDEKMVRKISETLYGHGIAYKISIRHYPLSKTFKVTFTTEAISEQVREIIAVDLK